MKETILKELNSRKLGMERQIRWHKESSDYEKTAIKYQTELSCMRGKLQELKDIIFYVEGL